MINPMELSGRRILVTGASSGLGRETAILLSRLGASVILVGRNREQLENTLALMEGENHCIEAFDLNNIDAISNWLKDVAARGEALSGLVHSAGIAATLPLRGTSSKKFREILELNFMAAVELTKAIRLKGVRADSVSVVYIASVAGLMGEAGLTAYSASKGALMSFARSAAVELAKEGIRVNCIVPGHVMTEMGEKTKATLPPEQFKALEAKHPLGFGAPRDVANAVAFLLADTGRWITGSSLLVDGGYVIS